MKTTEAKARGRANLAALLDPAVEQIAAILDDAETPPGARLAAAKLVIDAALDGRSEVAEVAVTERQVRMLGTAVQRALSVLTLTADERARFTSRLVEELRHLEAAEEG